MPQSRIILANPLIEALHIQSKLNAQQAALEPLYYEVIHNLVLETTRLGIDVKNLKMRVESMSSRLDFDERRARALEGVVQYRPGAVPPLQPPTGGGESREARGPETAEQSERRNRRRRRRGRRRPDERGPGGGPAPMRNGTGQSDSRGLTRDGGGEADNQQQSETGSAIAPDVTPNDPGPTQESGQSDDRRLTPVHSPEPSES